MHSPSVRHCCSQLTCNTLSNQQAQSNMQKSNCSTSLRPFVGQGSSARQKKPGRVCARKDDRKEEEARKALQGLFQGKKDLLAAYDTSSGSGGGSKGGGRKGTGGNGGGHDGNGWQMPDWRQWSSSLGGRLGRSMRALIAILGFVSVIFLMPVIPQALGAIVTLLKLVLRLDGRARSLPKRPFVDPFALAGTQNLGVNEISVISKYGNDGS